jgi:hypothetical protein
MSDRGRAIFCKAIFYGVAAATVLLIAAFYLLFWAIGLETKALFQCGVAVGIASVPIAEIILAPLEV